MMNKKSSRSNFNNTMKIHLVIVLLCSAVVAISSADDTEYANSNSNETRVLSNENELNGLFMTYSADPEVFEQSGASNFTSNQNTSDAHSQKTEESRAVTSEAASVISLSRVNKLQSSSSSQIASTNIFGATSNSPSLSQDDSYNYVDSNSTTSTSLGTTEEYEEIVILPTLPVEDSMPYTKTIYRQTLVWLGDTYTLSILIPVAAGIVFASGIIMTIATCKCLRRRMYRRRLRKKILPDTVKSMRASDRAKLLAESSDEEF